MKNYQFIGIIVSLLLIIIVNPVSDALRDNGNKKKSKNFELFREIATWSMLYFITTSLTFVIVGGVAHFVIRIAIHNLFYNISRKPKLPWYYVGTTSTSDEIESKKDIIERFFTRIFCLIFGVILIYIAIINI